MITYDDIFLVLPASELLTRRKLSRHSKLDCAGFRSMEVGKVFLWIRRKSVKGLQIQQAQWFAPHDRVLFWGFEPGLDVRGRSSHAGPLKRNRGVVAVEQVLGRW